MHESEEEGLDEATLDLAQMQLIPSIHAKIYPHLQANNIGWYA